MHFLVLGLSHKTSNIAIREQYFLSVPERELLLTELRNDPRIYESLVVSTCNRTEIYALMSEPDSAMLFQRLSAAKNHPITETDKDCFYTYTGPEAVDHLLSVSAGLDSLVLGEKEILGQLKSAIELARSKQMLGRFLNVLSNVAIRTGKMARSQTQIGCGGTSVSWAAVEMAKKMLESLEGKSVLIIGAGKMSQLAANDFKRKGIEQLFVMNRTEERGEHLAQKFNGTAVSFWKIEQILKSVDVCICSASAPHYLVETDLVSEIMKERAKALIMIDISMPRNIHPDIAYIDNVKLVSIDDLDKVIEFNVQQRVKAIHDVEAIIAKKRFEFFRRIDTTQESRENRLEEAAYSHL